MSWSDVGEVIKVVAPIFTAGAACTGVFIAYKGLEKWRAEIIGKRRADLAEQALIAFYEARDVFLWVRSRGIFGAEGSSRTPVPGETPTQQEQRNTYFIPIERLTREKTLFAKIQSLRYAFAAHFGESAIEPFNAISGAHTQIQSAASVLIKITPADDDIGGAFARDAPPLLNLLGWGMAARPDDIDRKIDKAVQDMENLCRPVLSGTPIK